PDTSSVRLFPNLAGAVQLSQRFRRVTVTGASNDRDRLLLAGRIDPPANLAVVLRSSDQTVAPVEYSRHADGSFTAVYDLTATGAEGGTVAAMSGGYHVRFGASADEADGWVRAADKLAIRPIDCFTEWNTLRVEARESEAVAVTASPPWAAQERTKHGRFAFVLKTGGRCSRALSSSHTTANPRTTVHEHSSMQLGKNPTKSPSTGRSVIAKWTCQK